MPIIKSKSSKAFKANMATEVSALKSKGVQPQKAVKQAAAISYSVKRKADKK